MQKVVGKIVETNFFPVKNRQKEFIKRIFNDFILKTSGYFCKKKFPKILAGYKFFIIDINLNYLCILISKNWFSTK